VLDVHVLESGGRPRVGWIVPKLGQGIVARNRLKRRLREIARRRVLGDLWRAGRECDVLVRVRRKAYESTYGRLEAEWTAGLEAIWSQS
jgi:ribonuclease P protein component